MSGFSFITDIVFTKILVIKIFVTKIFVTKIFVTKILVTKILVTEILVTEILVTEIRLSLSDFCAKFFFINGKQFFVFHKNFATYNCSIHIRAVCRVYKCR